MWEYQNTNELYHYGIKGMKWGKGASSSELKTVNSVINGKYGNGQHRINAMTKAGLNYNRIQSLVNGKMAGHDITKSSDENKKSSSKKLSDKEIKDIVNKVIRGNFGNGRARVKALTKAGYNYKEIQGKVNEKLLGKKIKVKTSKTKATKTTKTTKNKK